MGGAFFIAIAKPSDYNSPTMQLPFDFNLNRDTFAGILIGIVLVALVRASLGF